MKNSTILLFSIAILLLFSQALSSNRFLAKDHAAKAAALDRPTNSFAPHEDNRTHDHSPNNNSNNASFPPHQSKGHERPDNRPPHPPGNNSNFNITSAPQPADTNATRLLPSLNDTNSPHDRVQDQRANGTHGHQPKKSKAHRGQDNRPPLPPGNNTNFNNASIPQPGDADATRLLAPANNTSAGERRNATHAIRPRASAPSWNETERARAHERNVRRRAGGKGHRGNATHVMDGENGEDSFGQITRKLGEAMDKAFNHTSQGRGNQGHGRRPLGKGQNHAQGRNHTNFGEEHFGGHVWGNENGEEIFHAWNATKKA